MIGLYILALIIVGLLGFLVWIHKTYLEHMQTSEGRRLSAVASHDQVWRTLVDGLVKDGRERETALRGEIQALTEALGRSKEFVQVVYPRDERQPLEDSPGWYDSKKKIVAPNIKVTS